MYKSDRAWGDGFVAQVLTILKTLMAHLAVIEVASDEKDKSCATDFEVRLTGGTVAVRLRRPDCGFRDLTIRSHRDNGVKTELAKIREGHAFRYFYGWTNEQKEIAEWMLIDLDTARTVGLLSKERQARSNGDGTSFISIGIRELDEAGCILAYHFSERTAVQLKRARQVNPQASLDEGIKRAEQAKYYKPNTGKYLH